MDLYIILKELDNGHKKPLEVFLDKKEAKEYLTKYRKENPETKIITHGKTSYGKVFHSIRYIIK